MLSTSIVSTSIVSTVVDPILGLHGIAAYSLVGILAFAEAALFVGFVLPGETAVILGGVLAYRGSVSLTLMVLLVIVAAAVGDSVGFEVGRRYGQRLLQLRIFERHADGLETGRRRLHDAGGKAVFLARFTAFLRAVMPGLAGTAGMPYRTFVGWNVLGAIVWGGGFTLLGYAAGASYKTLESYAGRASEIVFGLVVVGAILLTVRHRRRSRDAENEPGTA